MKRGRVALWENAGSRQGGEEGLGLEWGLGS